jgi:asparagine synthetase B (glutamine-hydrolysing)
MSNQTNQNNQIIKNLLSKSICEKLPNNTALFFSGGIDSAVILNLLLENNIIPKLYSLKMDNIDSDDYMSFKEVSESLNLSNKNLSISENINISNYIFKLISFGIPKRKKASLMVMSLFSYLVDNTEEDLIYTGLGSDAYYGLGRDFAIKCSLKGEKIPSISSMKEYRKKTYNHYIEQYKAIKEYAKTKNKNIVAPFLEEGIYEFFIDKTYEECNKPKPKSILTSLYPEYFYKFKPRRPSNFHCGNSNFKKIKI